MTKKSVNLPTHEAILTADGWLHDALDSSQALVMGLELLELSATDPLVLQRMASLKERALHQGKLLRKARRTYGISILNHGIMYSSQL
jgi:hypothetical protein